LGPERRSRVWLDVHEDGVVVVDPQRLDQVLRNLIENALKFSPADSTVFVEGRVGDGRLELSVADQGVGIKPEDIPRIFDRFHQAGDALTREAEGAGLGLYITKRLVDAMGGNISVTSAPGEGATFRVSLPARPPADAADSSVATFLEGAQPAPARGSEATASGVRPSTS
ncbi:MAG: ATP-binding protein, partial [Actinomycetota bacterium]|nr:ATP-binding protein [Actinomycetota bacterium]